MEFPKFSVSLRDMLCHASYDQDACNNLYCSDCLLGIDAEANLVLTADIAAQAREYFTFKEE